MRDELESVGEIMEGALMDMGLVMIEDDSEDNTDGENSTLDESTLESPAAYGGGGREGASGGGEKEGEKRYQQERQDEERPGGVWVHRRRRQRRGGHPQLAHGDGGRHDH